MFVSNFCLPVHTGSSSQLRTLLHKRISQPDHAITQLGPYLMQIPGTWGNKINNMTVSHRENNECNHLAEGHSRTCIS